MNTAIYLNFLSSLTKLMLLEAHLLIIYILKIYALKIVKQINPMFTNVPNDKT